MASPRPISVVAFYSKQREVYLAALSGQFDVITLAAYLYVEIANKKCNLVYYREDYYRLFLEQNRDELPGIAKQIDTDMKMYWNASLVELSRKHDLLCKEYNDKETKYGRKSLYQRIGKPNQASLAMVRDDIAKAIKLLPQREFSDPRHVKFWRDVAGISSNVIKDTCDRHSAIVQDIKEIDQARYERLRMRFGVVTGLLSQGSVLLRLFLGSPG